MHALVSLRNKRMYWRYVALQIDAQTGCDGQRSTTSTLNAQHTISIDFHYVSVSATVARHGSPTNARLLSGIIINDRVHSSYQLTPSKRSNALP